MLAYLEVVAQRLDVELELLLAASAGFGVLLLLAGLLAALRRPDPAVARIAAISRNRGQDRKDRVFLMPAEKGPGAFMKAFIPSEKEKRSKLQRKLMQVGLTNPNAMQAYTLVRVSLALGLPAIFLALLNIARISDTWLPTDLKDILLGFSTLRIYQILSGLVAIGYFVPTYYLESKVKARKLRIEESFPNALDLMQVSIEAGLGFDAAMTRVGNELKRPSPEIAQEFLMVQYQVQAGRPRELAMRDMAERVGLDSIASFSNVVNQSIKFGTSMAQAMTTYAEELRQTREIRAQEMANKLPVKMSAVMASLMLPALVMMTIGPVVIRYIRNF
ncbi:MAG: type II secretion system protein [Rhodobacter sp.]|nr:type II secretion system protein [Rhodobacter sp.]